MTRVPKPLEQYRHFKGGHYQVLCIASAENTGEQLVIYQALYGDGKIWARPLGEFVSEVDHTRYPEVRQRWRFERILPPEEVSDAEGRTLDGAPCDESSGDSAFDTSRADPAGNDASRADSVGNDASRADPAGNDVSWADPAGSTFSSTDRNEGTARKDGSTARNTTSDDRTVQNSSASEGAQDTGALDPMVERFLDAATAEERLTILSGMRNSITDDMIDTMAVAVGVEVEPGPVPLRYEDLRDCLMTIDRYELERDRLRGR